MMTVWRPLGAPHKYPLFTYLFTMSNAQRRAQNNPRRNQTNVSRRSVPLATDVIIIENNARKLYPSDDRILLTTIAGSSGFSTTKLTLNPGVSFGDREGNIAKGYGKYTAARDWYLDFVPKKSKTYAGTVMCGIDYEAGDEAPATAIAMSTYQNFGTAPVHASWRMPLRRRLMFDGVQHKLIRCGPSATSLSITDACAIMIGTDGCDDTNNVLDVYLGYYLHYSAAQTSPTIFTPNDIVVKNLSANQAFTSTVAALLDFDETIVDGFVTVNTNGSYAMPCGAFCISGEISFTDSSAEVFTTRVELLIDGVATVPPQLLNGKQTESAAAVVVIPFTFYTSSAVAFTLGITCSLIGSAGTLLALGDQSRMKIEAVN
jgi:hypothetical protein